VKQCTLLKVWGERQAVHPSPILGEGQGWGLTAGHNMTDTPDKRFTSAPPTSGGTFDFIYNPKFRGYASQVIVLGLLAWGVYEIVLNTQANLARLNKQFGFDFLGKASGFDVSTSLIQYSSSSNFGRALLVGFYNTVLVAVLGIIFATILGFIIGVMRLSKNWVISRFALGYVELVRNVPLLVQILAWYTLVLKPLPGVKGAFTYFGGSVFLSNRGVSLPHPNFGAGAWFGLAGLAIAIALTLLLRRWARLKREQTGQSFPAGWISAGLIIGLPVLAFAIAGWPVEWDYPELAGFNFKNGMTLVPECIALLLALVIYTASYIAELVRSGIQAVSHGQTEASKALGLDTNKTLRLVVVPQAMRVIIPPLASQYLNLTKNSSLAVAIGYPDLMYAGGTVNNQSGAAIEVFTIVLIVYLATSLFTAAFMNWFNSRMKLVER
jgi:general L-amino acid transport system permease protein